jgi:Protein kinase domain
MDTRDVIARFEAERQALALMDHPNIARVLDAGTTESGRPYFVMELVRGVPITEYCDKYQLTPRERLELFVDVCNAIQHAHLKGIIHRDIKPTNVLVAQHDDRPVVKVIDFGVAKALHQPLTEKTIYTRLTQMVGTPLYMSPEQAQMSGLDIDTRSDIYSLGVLLYELLTGTTPLDKQRLAKAAYDELLKIIREEEPPKPSLRLSQSGDAIPSIAAQRKTEPARLSKMFHGDVDWIAMKALEKDRARRYETVNAFAADVLRYLNDEPVEASPPSTAYRLRKLARKHRKPVIALVAIVAVLMLGIAGTTWGTVRARQAERAAGASEKKAITAREQTERQFVNGLLRPIGLFTDYSIGPAELNSFVDWSAIKESPLKMRVLEIALDKPETALRVAQRAQHAIQSCVGLSVTRRAQAIRLVSARQRDRAADPRIRVAACRLAMELGSADLPAWAESCQWLSDPKNHSIHSIVQVHDDRVDDPFAEFVDFALNRSDPQQITPVNLESFLAILETSANDGVRLKLCNVIPQLAPRLEPGQVERAANALIAIAKKSTDGNPLLMRANDGLTALAPRLQPAQAMRVWDTLIGMPDIATNYSLVKAASCGLTVLAPRFESAQVKRAGDALIGMLEKSTQRWVLALAANGLKALAPRFESAQAKRAWDALTGTPVKSRDSLMLLAAHEALHALAPRLEPAQARREGDVVIAMLEKSTYNRVLILASSGFISLAPRLESAQFKRVWDAVIAKPEKSPPLANETDDNDPDHNVIAWSPERFLEALPPHLEPADAKHAGDACIATLEKSTQNRVLILASSGLLELAPRLEPAQAKRAGDALITILEKSKDVEVLNAANGGLKALVPRLKRAQVKRASDTLIAAVEKSRDANVLQVAHAGLMELGQCLEPAQSKRAADAWNAILEKSRDHDALQAASSGLQTLAPRLEPAQVSRAWNDLLAVRGKLQVYNLRQSVEAGLQALAPGLDSAQAERDWDALIGMLEKSTDDDVYCVADSGLTALAPRLESAQAKRAWDALIAVREPLAHGGVENDWAWEGLVALAPRLDVASRDNLSTAATVAVLDYCSCIDPARGVGGASRVPDSIVVARSISSPRSMAKLLSHPACVAKQRDVLLKRFEELVFYDGKPVLLRPDATDRKKPDGAQFRQRRFHNLHDAGDWIQKNWPDFDLETNCPVTWRGSR